jgi:hypothetical protein
MLLPNRSCCPGCLNRKSNTANLRQLAESQLPGILSSTYNPDISFWQAYFYPPTLHLYYLLRQLTEFNPQDSFSFTEKDFFGNPDIN